jgi:integrase
MGVTYREFPKGSGRWVVFVSRGKFRMNHAVKGGKDRAAQVAKKLDAILDLVGIEGVAEFLRRGARSAQPIPTVKHYATRWLEIIERTDLKRSTRIMYSSNVKNHIIPGLGKYLITEIDYALLKDFLSAKTQDSYSTGRFRKQENIKLYKNSPANERRYSRDTVRIIAMTLRAMFREAAKDKIVSANPVEGLSQFYRKRKRDREVKRSDVYTLDELYKVEDVLQNKRNIFGEDYEFSLLMSRTGMRIGEARGLLLSDMDFEAATGEIKRNIPSGHNELEDTPKTQHSERTVDLSPELVDALKSMFARRRLQGLKSGRRQHADEWLFATESGQPYDYYRFYERWNRAQQLAGVRQRSPHSLRHTYASQMLAHGKDIGYISKQLGHANPGITLSIYVHFIPGKKTGTENVLDREFASNLHHKAGNGISEKL